MNSLETTSSNIDYASNINRNVFRRVAIAGATVLTSFGIVDGSVNAAYDERVPAGGSVCVDTDARPGEGILVNATAVEPVAPGYLNVRNPAAQWDANSSVNHGTGGAVANEVFVQPDAQGNFCVSTYSSSHVILDILGYTAPNMVRPATPSGSADRVLDTRAPRKGEDYQCAIGDYFKTIDIYDSAGKWIGQRDESWCYGDTLPATKVPAGGSVDVGSGARPGEGILVNATAVEPVAPGYLNVRNPAAQWDANSSVNHGTGGAVANEVFVQPDAQGKFSVSTFSKTHIILDILGYTAPNMVRPATANGSADRVLDTRQSMRGPDYQCAAGERADYYKVISYPDGSQMTVGMCYGDTLPASKVPAGGSVCVDTDARPGEGILVNATAVEPVAPGYLNVRNPAAQWDANSSVNHGTGGAVANEVFVQPDAQGNFCVSTYSSSHVILDILGYTAPNMVRPATPSGSADRVLDTRQ